MTTNLCGRPHYDYPDTLCTEPAGHYRRETDPHAGPLIFNGRQRGAAAWDEPEETHMSSGNTPTPEVKGPELRHTVDTITSDALDALHADRDRLAALLDAESRTLAEVDARCDWYAAELAALRQVARGYCPACGRGDAAPTATDWEQQRQRAETAEAERARYAKLAEDRAERVTRITADRDQLRTRLAEQEAETMRQHERAQRAEAAAATPRELDLRQRSAWVNAGWCPMCGDDGTDGRLCPDCTATVRKLPARQRREWRRYEPVTASTPIQSHGYTPAGLLGIDVPPKEG